MNKALILFGMPGSGKSTSGKIVSEKLGYAFYDMDATLPETMKEKLRNGSLITEEEIVGYVKETVEEVDLLFREKSAVVCLSLFLEKHRLLFKQRFPKALFFSLEARPEVLQDRLMQRKNHFFNEKLFKETLVTYEPIGFDHYSIDANKDLDTVVSSIIGYQNKF